MKDPVKMAVGKTIKDIAVRVHEEERTTTLDIHFTDGTQLSLLATVKVEAHTSFYRDDKDEKPIERTIKCRE